MVRGRSHNRSFGFRLEARLAARAFLLVALATAAVAKVSGAGSPLRPPAAVPATPAPAGRSGKGAPEAVAPLAAPATPAAEVPQLLAPREVTLMDAPAAEAGRARTLFDGDPGTALTAPPGKRRAVFVDLGGARALVGLGLAGSGRARVEVLVDGDGGRRALDAAERVVDLRPGRWSPLPFPAAARATGLVIAWAAADAGGPATVAEVALFALGPAVDEDAGAIPAADRLVTGLPANAIQGAARPESAQVARVTSAGPQGARFTLMLDRDPDLLGRAFLVYELERLAHWTGPTRSINGHVARGGYRAHVRGTGGVQVEEIAPAWLRRGENSVSFDPSNAEDRRGYVVRNVRVVGVPHAPAAAASAQPAYFAFDVERAGPGMLALFARGADRQRRAPVRIDLERWAAGWQAVPLDGALPPGAGVRVAVGGRGGTPAVVGETRVVFYPSLSAGGALAIAYPLHGECLDHQVYVRGFVRGAGPLGRATLTVGGEDHPGALDADGSFAAVAREPDAVRGKPWEVDVEVAAADGTRWRTELPIDVCTEPAVDRRAFARYARSVPPAPPLGEASFCSPVPGC